MRTIHAKSNNLFQPTLVLLTGFFISMGATTLPAQSFLDDGNGKWGFPTEHSMQPVDFVSPPENSASTLWNSEPGVSYFDSNAGIAPMPMQHSGSAVAENKAAAELWDSSGLFASPYSQFQQNQPASGNVPPVGVNVDQRVHFGLEAVFLTRSKLTGDKFVFDDNGGALSYSDLDASSSTDMRFRWSRVDGDGRGLEMVVLKSNSFDERTVVDGPNVIPVFYYSIPANPEPSWDIEYNSDLESYEVNWWTGGRPDLRYGLGGRFINLREDFNITDTADPTSGFFSDSDNDLFGVQFLAEFRRWINNRVALEAGNRTGIYYNNIDVRAFAANGELHRETDAFSFVGNWNAGFRLYSSGLGSWKLGYEAILLTGVAIAPDQNEALRIFDPDFGEIVTGSAFYHGVYGGFELMF